MTKITMQVEFSSVAEAAKFLAGAGQALPATVQIRSEPDDVAQTRESATSAAIMNAGPTSAPNAGATVQSGAAASSVTSVGATAASPSEADVKTAANAYLAKQGGRTPETARAIFAKHGGAVNGVTKPANIPEANRAACIAELNAS